MASCFCGSIETAEAFLNYLFFRARDLIETRWWAVEAVADALVTKRRLRYADVVAVINRGATNEQQIEPG